MKFIPYRTDRDTTNEPMGWKEGNMSLAAVIGLIVLILVIVAGIGLKWTFHRKLEEMDGIGNAAIVTQKEASRVLCTTENKREKNHHGTAK